MREVLITNAAASYDIIGGASKAIDDIAEQLSTNFNKVYIFVPNRSGIKKHSIENISPRILIIRYKYFKNFRILNPILAFISYLKYFGFKKFDLIWGNSPEPWLFIPKNSKKKIYTVHGPWKAESALDKSKKNKLRDFFIDLAYSLILKSDILFHFQSNYVYNECLKECSKFKSIRKIISPVLLNERKLLSMCIKPKRNYSKKLNLLVARRLVNRTGVIEFMSLTEGIDDLLNITIIGDGYQSKSIKNQISSRSNIRFLGKVDDSTLYQEIAECDLVCMPSLDAEGFGASILQALFLLKPVLYTNVGGMKEFLQNNPDCYSFDLFQKEEFKNQANYLMRLKSEGKLGANLENINYVFIKNLNEILDA